MFFNLTKKISLRITI